MKKLRTVRHTVIQRQLCFTDWARSCGIEMASVGGRALTPTSTYSLDDTAFTIYSLPVFGLVPLLHSPLQEPASRGCRPAAWA